MRVIYLHQYFETPSVPGGTRSYEMGRRLVSWGHEVQMVTSDKQPGARRGWRETDEAGMRVHWFPVPYSNRMPYLSRIRAFMTFAAAAARKASALRGEVVFATSTPLTVALPAVYASRRGHIPMVFEVRDLWPELPIAVKALRNPVAVSLARRLERFAYRNASRVVALSPGMKDGIVKTGYPGERVTVIPNGCDFDVFAVPPERGQAFRRSHEWLQDRPLVVYVGTLGRINGVDYLARLAAQVRQADPDIRFLVVGSGGEEEKVRQVAESEQVLNRNFFMLPPMPKLEAADVLSAASIAASVFVDLKEMEANCANKFFDALAAGRAIAINYGGWQAEMLEETGAGLVLDVRDVKASAGKLLGRMRDKEWLGRAGEAARRLGETRFSRDVLARRLEGVLRDAVEEREAP